MPATLLFPVLVLLSFAFHAIAAEPPNIVFILSDNQSYYEMGCHGHADLKTPNIDQLAGESVDFQNFHAPPYCSPSRAVILTGQYAMRHGIFTTIAGRSILHKDATTLPEVLKGAGYHSAIFGKWHLGFSYPYRPKDRGFDEVFVHGGGGIGQLEDYYGNTLFDSTFIHNDKVTPSKGYNTDVLFERAMAYIEAKQDERFFCFVSTPVTHSPHHGPKELVAKLKADGVEGNLELYGQIQNLDSNIGKMMAKLDELGMRDNTVLIYASDQGMSDRGAPHGGQRKGLGYDPAHHVPFMVRLPGAEPKVSRRLAGMIDFYPTILELCGVESPTQQDGLSLLPLIKNDPGYPADRTLVIQCPRGKEAMKWKNAVVKTDRWRLVGQNKLYDAQQDPRQNTDVAGDQPEVVKQLRAVYEAYWDNLPEPTSTLCRHLLGHPDCRDEITLNAMDWYRGATPWHRGAYKGKARGAWAVTVVEDGRYRFEGRHFPREADKADGASAATFKLGSVTAEQELEEGAKMAVFEVELKKGEFDLEIDFTVNDKQRGALFVYVQKLPSK